MAKNSRYIILGTLPNSHERKAIAGTLLTAPGDSRVYNPDNLVERFEAPVKSESVAFTLARQARGLGFREVEVYDVALIDRPHVFILDYKPQKRKPVGSRGLMASAFVDWLSPHMWLSDTQAALFGLEPGAVGRVFEALIMIDMWGAGEPDPASQPQIKEIVRGWWCDWSGPKGFTRLSSETPWSRRESLFWAQLLMQVASNNGAKWERVVEIGPMATSQDRYESARRDLSAAWHEFTLNQDADKARAHLEDFEAAVVDEVPRCDFRISTALRAPAVARSGLVEQYRKIQAQIDNTAPAGARAE